MCVGKKILSKQFDASLKTFIVFSIVVFLFLPESYSSFTLEASQICDDVLISSSPNSVRSDTRVLNLNQKITHISPSNTTRDLPPTFMWEAHPDSTWYKLWIGTLNESKVFANWYKASTICSNNICSIQPDIELSDGDYVWFVKSWNEYDNIWSDGMRFSIYSEEIMPSKVLQILPSGTVENSNLEYTWDENLDSTWYKLWIGTLNGTKVFGEWYEASTICSNIICSILPDLELSDGDYLWYVKSWNDYGNIWSDGMSFSIADDEQNTPSPKDLFSTKGDGICQEGETLISCPEDCNTSVTSYVKKNNNRPVLYVNEKEIPFTGFTLYNPDDISCGVPFSHSGWVNFIKEQIDKTREANATYLNFDVPFTTLYKGTTPPSLNDLENRENWDIQKIEDVLNYAVTQGVYLVLDFTPHNPPSWWKSQNSDQLQVDNTSEPTQWGMVGFNNSSYWDTMDPYIETFVTLFKDQPALLGWYVRGGITGENNYPPSYLVDLFSSQSGWCDVSEYAVSRFQGWLENNYSNINVLNNAWGTSYTGFNDVNPPDPLDDLTTLSEQLELENSAGDRRTSFMDWHRFRLEEKTADFNHFFDLVKTVDPDHIILTDPAFNPLQGAKTQSGTGDGHFRYSYGGVDGILHHPRVSFDDEPGTFNVNRKEYQQVVRFAGLYGKLTSWVNEDTGEINRCIDEIGDITSFEDCCSEALDSDACLAQYATISESRINSISGMLAAEGGGCGWVVGGTCLDNPTWSGDELDVIKTMNTLFSIPNREGPVSRIAILSDPYSDDLFYQRGTNGQYTRSHEREQFLDMMFTNGIAFTGLTVDDLTNVNLDDFSVVVILHMPVISEAATNELVSYRNNGGGLFILGRCGVFNESGTPDDTALTALLGCNNQCITEDLALPARPQSLAWSFVDTEVDPLLIGLTKEKMSTDNFITTPVFDLTANGYTPLAFMDDFPSVSPVGFKGKTLFWFSALGDNEKLGDFLKNAWRFFNVNIPSQSADVEVYGGSHKYLMAKATGSYQLTLDLSHDDDFDSQTVLMWDWVSMTELTSGTLTDRDGSTVFETNINLTADTPVFAGFTPLGDKPRLIAVSGATIYQMEEEKDRLMVGLARLSIDDPVTLVYYPGNTSAGFAINGGELSSQTTTSDGMICTIVINPTDEVCSIVIGNLPDN